MTSARVIDERRKPRTPRRANACTRATRPRSAAAATSAMPGDLEDLGGGGGGFADAVADIPDKAELERLRNEVGRASSS